jgi:hypothetical protein
MGSVVGFYSCGNGHDLVDNTILAIYLEGLKKNYKILTDGT